MKGFKDSSNKFHPITDYKKGVRKSRDQSAKSGVVRLERNASRKPVLNPEGNDTRMRMISVSVRLIPYLGEMNQLRPQELEELKGELRYLTAKSHEERVKARKEREGQIEGL